MIHWGCHDNFLFSTHIKSETKSYTTKKETFLFRLAEVCSFGWHLIDVVFENKRRAQFVNIFAEERKKKLAIVLVVVFFAFHMKSICFREPVLTKRNMIHHIFETFNVCSVLFNRM